MLASNHALRKMRAEVTIKSPVEDNRAVPNSILSNYKNHRFL